MGKIVELSDYRETLYQQPAYYRSSETVPLGGDSEVPVEFAAGNPDRQACLQVLAEYGIDSVQERRVREGGDAIFHMISVTDAIRLNKQILEREDLTDEEIASHIDVIQMLENLDLSMLERLWSSFTVLNRS